MHISKRNRRRRSALSAEISFDFLSGRSSADARRRAVQWSATMQIGGAYARARRRCALGVRGALMTGWCGVAAVLLLALASVPTPAVAANSRLNLGIDNDYLYTSSAAYCSQPGALLVNGMGLKFMRRNNTLDFDLSANAAAKNANASVDLHVYAFGMDLFELQLNLCSIGSGELCPLPTYNFTGSGLYHVPPQFATKIPSIAYTALDLEALAVLRLTDVQSNNTLACLQVTLSNGRTARQKGIVWGTLGAVAFGIVAALFHTAWVDSLGAAQWRIVDLVWTVQQPVFVSFITLIFPRVFHQYSLTFAWSAGLVFIESVQASILSTRTRTGSYDTGTYSFGPTLVEQLQAQMVRFSNLFAASRLGARGQTHSTNATAILGSAVPQLMHHRRWLRRRQEVPPQIYDYASHAQQPAKYAPNTGPGGELQKSSTPSSIVWAAKDTDFEDLGVSYYSTNLDISPKSMFLTLLVNWLLVLCAVLAAVALTALAWRVLRAWCAPPGHATYSGGRARSFAVQVVRPVGIRLLEILTPIMLVSIFYQWSHSGSWVAHFVAAITAVCIAAFWLLALLPMLLYVKRTRDAHSLYFSGSSSPWDTKAPAARLGSLAHPWRPRFYWFTAVVLLCHVLRACFLGFPQGNDYGLRQTVGLAVVETLFLIVLCVCRPGRDKTTDFVQIVLAIFRVLTIGVCIALTTTLNVWAIPRAVLGYALIVLTALPIIFIFCTVAWDAVSPLLRRRLRYRATEHSDAAREKHGDAPQHARPDAQDPHEARTSDTTDDDTYVEANSSPYDSNTPLGAK